MAKPRCCVEGCKNFPPHFKFPTSRVLVRKWLSAIGSRCKLKSDPHTMASVCSGHFRSEEWECARGRVRLKKGVVPSLFDESISAEKQPTNLTADTQTTNATKNSEENPNIARTDNKNNSDDPQTDTSEAQNDKNDLEKDKVDKSKDTEGLTKENELKDKLGEEGMANGRKNSGEERVQESCKSEEDTTSNIIVDSRKSNEKCKESTPKLPSGPRDIDKGKQEEIDKSKEEDIEELLTYYHIKQNNIHHTEEVPIENVNGTSDNQSAGRDNETIDIEFEMPPAVDPVFIEISVDKDSNQTGDKADCLMVLESVQVEIDPSALMLQEQDPEPDVEMETMEIHEDPPTEKEDPISLLTSSDEDDVIIQEPHIDTVEVSDETDEDDLPLVKLLRRRRAEKKKITEKKITEKKKTEKRSVNSVAQITWGLYEYYCVQCHFKTSSAAEYRRHMAAHAKVILMCQLCGYMTASSSQFTKHEKQHGEKTYKCNLCDFKAKRNMSLVYHMKTHKTKEFKCGECDFVASSDQVILKHLRFCDSVKKHKCDKCSYSTKKRSDLKRHKSRKHVEDDEDEDYVPPARCMD